MRVMMLSWEYPPRIVGGISPHVYELSQQLVKHGIDVHVITKETPLAPDEEVEPSGVKVHRVHLAEKPNDFIHEIQLLNEATELRVRQLLEDWRPGGEPTVFHAHDWLSLDAARELKYEYALPLIGTVHATEEGRNQGIHNDMQRYIHEQEYWLTYESWRVIVTTEYMRGELVRSFNVPENKVDRIYNGVTAKRFQFDWPDEERLRTRAQYAEPDEKIVMYAGRFVREKGIHVLLNAASAVLAQEPKTKFILVGRQQDDKFQRFADWYGLGDRVTFAGFKSGRSLYEMYRIADVTVFPSLYEPFGIVALEGMAAGVPVVTSDAGGLKEVVLHDKTGTLSFAGDPNSLAWAILRVLQDPVRARALAQNALTRLQEEFDWDLIAQQTCALYERVWAEFLSSYWAEETLWPVSAGAQERAEEKHVREKVRPEAIPQRPRPVAETVPDLPATLAHEEQTERPAEVL